MNPKIKKLKIEIANYERAIAKRDRQIEHFRDIIERKSAELEELKPKRKPKKKVAVKKPVEKKVVKKKAVKKKAAPKSKKKGKKK